MCFFCICAYFYFQITRNFFSKKDIFYHLEWLIACFDAFPHTSRPTETFFQKKYFLLSGVVKKMFWCIFTYFQITRNFFFRKDTFNCLEWLKTFFYAFAHTSRPDQTFLTTPVGKKYLFWKKVSGDLEVSKNASKHVFELQTVKNIFFEKSFWCSGSMRSCIKTRF